MVCNSLLKDKAQGVSHWLLYLVSTEAGMSLCSNPIAYVYTIDCIGMPLYTRHRLYNRVKFKNGLQISDAEVSHGSVQYFNKSDVNLISCNKLFFVHVL